MDIQLRSIFCALYPNKNNPSPLLYTVKGEIDTSNDPFAFLRHPAVFRWVLPLFANKVRNVYLGTSAEQIEDKMVFFDPVVRQIDFIRQHFHPVYEQIGFEFELENKNARKTNLKEFMGISTSRARGSRSTIQTTLAEWFSDPEHVREFVITQWLILDHYEYRPDYFRACIVEIIDTAIESQAENSSTSAHQRNRQYSDLLHLRNLVLELFSKGHDATALSCMLLVGALGDKARPILDGFENGLYSDCFQLTLDETPRRQDLGSGYYLTFYESSNFVGGRRKSDITLWKYPATMIEKINDRFGFFFYPVEINDPEKLGIHLSSAGEQIKYVSSIGSFADGKALFKWMYQPDGRYFEDDDGFGAENCEKIILYAYLNEKGRFVTPFALTASYCE